MPKRTSLDSSLRAEIESFIARINGLDLAAAAAQTKAVEQPLGFQLFKIVFDDQTGYPVGLLEVKMDVTLENLQKKISEVKHAVPFPRQ